MQIASDSSSTDCFDRNELKEIYIACVELMQSRSILTNKDRQILQYEKLVYTYEINLEKHKQIIENQAKVIEEITNPSIWEQIKDTVPFVALGIIVGLLIQ